MNERRVWLAAGLVALVLAAPVAFGSTSGVASMALALGISSLALAALVSGARPAGSWPMVLLLILPCVQLIPLPGWLLGAISLQAGRFHALADATAGTGNASISWHPISLDPHATMRGALLLGSAACLFGVARFCLTHPIVRRLLTGGLLAMGMFEASYGLAGHLSGKREILGWPKTYYLDSATGTFVNRNHFAGYLEMTLMISLGILVVLAGGRDRRRRDGSPPGWLGGLVAISTPRGGAGLLLAAAACVMVAGLLFSRSRAGLASAGAGLIVLVTLSEQGRARRIALSLIAAVVILGGLYAFTASPDPVTGRFGQTMRDLTGSEGRVPLWGDAARSAAAFAVTGSGLLAFEQVFPALRTHEDPQLRTHAHNDYIELAAEMGLPGLVLALFLLARFLRDAARGASRHAGGGEEPLARGCALGGIAAAAALAFHSFFDFNLHVPANLLTLALVCALALPAPQIFSNRGPHRMAPAEMPS